VSPLQYNNSKRCSIKSFVDTLQQFHHTGLAGLSADWLRRVLSEALQAYSCIVAHSHDHSSTGLVPVPEYPCGALAHCAACWGSAQSGVLHSVYIDACFKLAHNTAAGGGSEAPPNRRFFLDESEVEGFERDAFKRVVGATQPPLGSSIDDKQCSDFDAGSSRVKKNKQVTVISV
jgi:hypothetical protein